ncbi:MAG: DUF4175 family protein [Cytophagaceae bacterium]|nr:DUF4175 family protein [Cytophagaceae bacterium]MDW8455900.1 DUF4175 family protein [Cytophagaceae bacterium]
MIENTTTELKQKLVAYKKKYYLNILLRGSIFFVAITSSSYLFFTSLEYFGKFSTPARLAFLVSFAGISVYTLYKWIARPCVHLLNLNRSLTDEQAAIQIGQYFPQVKDKLLNTLQLSKLSPHDNALLTASIEQRTRELKFIPFAEAVRIEENKKYLRYIIPPAVAIILLLIFIPQMLTESTARIINYKKTFAEPAPFIFEMANNTLQAYKNEDFEIVVNLKGKSLADQVYVINKGKRSKMKKNSPASFSYVFKSLQQDETFYFEAAGFNSYEYTIKVISRPELRVFETQLEYPAYLNKKNESLRNAANLTVPEGTSINWIFETSDAEKLNIQFSSESKKTTITSNNNTFRYSKRLKQSENYTISLENSQSSNKELIQYSVSVIKDQYPTIAVERYNDTILYNYISLGGKITDDYGIKNLQLLYRITTADESAKNHPYKIIAIPLASKAATQNFYYNLRIDTLNIKPGDKLEYYLQVWDNDGVNGSKSSRTATFEFKFPTEEEFQKNMAEASAQAENKMEELLQKTLALQQQINKIQQKLKTQKSLGWQEKRDLDNMMKKHEELKNEIEQLTKQNQQLSEKQKKFDEISQETLYKMEQLQKLFNDILDEETKRLYEELRKMLEEKASKDMIDKMLDKIKNKDEYLKDELNRALEMFRQIQFDKKLDDIISNLDKLSKEQEELSKKTEEKNSSSEKLSKEQEQLNEKFENIKEQLKELKNINESLENKKDMEDTKADENSIEQDMQDSKQNLENNQKNKAAKAQKNASQKMQKMSQKLSQMKSEMAMEEMQENLDDLRDILENLITLSFEQEALMKDFKKISHSDPRYVQLAQKQLKLKDDSKIIEDSLMALAKRVFEIQSFVTREVKAMKNYMDESLSAIKARRTDVAAGKQQFAMTSINNLALMLNESLKQMQQQMQQMQSGQGTGQCKKPGKNKSPGLGELQKQLNQQIDQLRKSGKTGRELSEELARLAAQQEMIRKMLKELEEKGANNEGGKDPGNQLSELKKLMEETEKDLVNKRITQETILRQQEILTRLLESEKATRERELDDKREAESAKEKFSNIPPSFEKYLKAKEKQIDLLKTVPPSLTPYYKQEVNEYFQKLEN